MKSLLLSLLLTTLLSAQQDDWHFERIGIYLENDVFFDTDLDYTDASKFSALLNRTDPSNTWLHIPFTSQLERTHFISFSYVRQMFTPDDIKTSDYIKEDRPYAGWLYAEVGLYQTSSRHLDALVLQVGIVGPASYTKEYQKVFHQLMSAPDPKGWGHQLNNEVGVQLDYQHKWRFIPAKFLGVSSSVIPYVSGEFGNIAIKANAGASFRLGWNVPNDFDTSTIDDVGEGGVPTQATHLIKSNHPWSLYLNLASGGSVVARDIFLDGNTFSKSHSVEKNLFRAYGRYGFSARYKQYELNFVNIYNTEHYKSQDFGHRYSGIYLSYLFN